MARAFIIRPFGVKVDSGGSGIDFDRVHNELIEPALGECKVAGSTTGEIVEPGNIREDMFALIIEADIVICDVTIHNANVFYELGIRHALRKKRTVLIKGKPAVDATPFDILTDRYVPYDVTAPARALPLLTETIKAAFAAEREADSPVFKMLPGLPEADPATVQVVPLALGEEIQRARTARSKGWLRLLAYEVRQTRFAGPALLTIAEALWRLKDYEAARETYELVRSTTALDPESNLALANIYERLYREEQVPEFLTSSDQAISRVLGNKSAAQSDRVEALALRGRNAKTRWREQFAHLEGRVEARRKMAMNGSLRQAYAGYADAFREDLNHFWSGLAALQMGVIFLDLSKDEGWTESFDTDVEAHGFLSAVQTEVSALKVVVMSSIESGLKRLARDHPDRVWADISKADLLFLTEDATGRVIKRYLDAIPTHDPFAWDAARGQLALFELLGVRADLAHRVIETIDARDARDTRADVVAASAKPVHVLMFAGHRFDEPGRPTVRFPATLEQRAYSALLNFLRRSKETHNVIGFASGSIGSDILFHEACRELGVPSTLCLPIPADEYVNFVAPDLTWRSRLLTLIQEKRVLRPSAVLELHNAPGLPTWLQGSGTNEWERGNRWVLEMAVSVGAPKVTLLTLWDGQEAGDSPGGTAHMVSLARASSNVDIKVITPQELLSAASSVGNCA
jgi:hypothetical protein